MSSPTHIADGAESRGIDRKAVEALFAATAQTVAVDPRCAAQVAIGFGGEVVAFGAFGRAPFADGVAEASRESLFCLYSCTKAVVSSAVWILLGEGSLGLSDRVADHFPEFGAHGKQGVTVEQLLTHTSGFPSATFPLECWPDPTARRAELACWELEWEPGSRFVYHGVSSMWVLAELMSRVSGDDYRDFIRTRIVEPLGLADLFLGVPGSEHCRIAEVVFIGEPAAGEEGGVSPVDAPVLRESDLDHANDGLSRSLGNPAGGVFSSAAGLALFYQALLADSRGQGRGVWSASGLADAWTPRNPDFIDPMTQRPALRGLGVVIAGERGKIWRGFAPGCSARAFGHMGAGGQVSWADPATGLSFVYCTNGAQLDPVRQGATGLQLSSLATDCLA